MKDIKHNKKIVQAKVEKVTALFVHENLELRAEGNKTGKYMLAGMIASVFVYLFFVTSSIFYAVNTQKYAYEIENLNTLALESGTNLIAVETSILDAENQVSKINKINYVNKKDRVSYINKNADTAISLK